MKIDFKENILPLLLKLLPHFLIILAFNVVVVVYFSDHFTKGEVLSQGDIVSYRGMAKQSVDYKKEHNGETAFWVGNMFGGMPNYMIDVEYNDFNYLVALKQVLNPFRMGHPVSLVLFGLICAYILLLSLRVNKYAAAIGAFAYAFATFTIVSLEAGHNAKVEAMYFAPLVLAGMVVLFDRGNILLGGLLTAIGSALMIVTSHYQITYYLFFVLLIYALVKGIALIIEGKIGTLLKYLAVLLVAGTLGVAANANRLLSTYEYSKESIRGKADLVDPNEATQNAENEEKPTNGGLTKKYAFDWSYGKAETFTILIPGFYGNKSGMELDKKSHTYRGLKEKGVPTDQAKQFIKNAPMYHGDQPFTSGPAYFGAIICFLFILGLVLSDNQTRAWLIGGALIALFLAWGRNFSTFNYLLFDYLPGFNKFRAVSMAMFLANLIFVAGAMIGIGKVLSAENKQALIKPFMIAVAITGGVMLLALIGIFKMDYSAPVDERVGWVADYLVKDRASIAKTSWFRSLAFIVLAAGVIFLYLRNNINTAVSILLIGLFVVIDLWSVDKQYLNNDNFVKDKIEDSYEKNLTAADRKILSDTSYFRIFNLTTDPFNDSKTSYFHNSIGGYHAVKLKRYQDVISRHISKNNTEVINMLNTKYIIRGTAANQVLTNPGAFGPAWFVNKVKYVNSPLEEINALNNKDLKTTAYVDQTKFKASNTDYTLGPDAKVEFVENNLNSISYKTSNSAPGFLVLSEIYYPEWEAYVDGKKVDLLRANYILRALEVPAGEHLVELKINPKTYNSTKPVTQIISISLVVLLIILILFYLYRYLNSQQQQTDELEG